MHDIIFDFSASPVGGGLRRLDEYIRYFSTSKRRVLFLVHPSLGGRLAASGEAEIRVLPRPAGRRILDDSGLVSEFAGKSGCFFSYGIPIYRRMADIDWLHLSNALPFDYRRCSMSAASRIKNALLLRMFRRGHRAVDILSGESLFTLDLYRSVIPYAGRAFVLRNGVDASLAKGTSRPSSARDKVAVTIGTEPYKRLSLVLEAFLRLKETRGLTELCIIGDERPVPKAIRGRRDVRTMGVMGRAEVLKILRASECFISASEIENSSNGVLEAALCGCACMLSRIPSHLEMLADPEGIAGPVIKGTAFAIIDRSSLSISSTENWDSIIEGMLREMHGGEDV